MLQVDNLRRIEQQTPRDEFLTLAEFYVAAVGFLRRQFSVIMSALLVSLLLGAVYIFASPAIYTGRATLIVDASKTQLFQSQQSRGSLPVISAIVDTQIQILTSDELALSVIKSLNLDNDPEFTSPRTGILGAVTEFAGEAIKSVLNSIVPEVSEPSINPTAEFRALRTFQKRLEVKRMALTYAIEIAFASHNPYRAAQISNAIADTYEINAFVAKHQITGRSAEWLHDRLKELREQTSNSERAVVDSEKQLVELNRESRLITRAQPPTIKSWPDPLLVMALATLGGLIFGAAIGMLRDVSDRVFRNPLQIDELLHADCIAVVPLVKAHVAGPNASFKKVKAINPALQTNGGHVRLGIVGWLRWVSKATTSGIISAVRKIFSWIIRIAVIRRRHLLGSPNRQQRGRRRRTISRDKRLCWTVINSPISRFTEAIRAVKVAADRGNIAKTSKAIGITSSVPNEGKSTIAISFAALIAKGGGRVILVDCDLRNPGLSRMLTPDAKAGMLEIIAGKARLDDILWHEPATRLAFLPIVATSRLAHSSDILSSQETQKLFEQLRELYDYVIVDLPPVAPVVDVRVVSHLVDSFLLVVEWGRTKIDVVQLALGNARGVCDNLLGVVLNKADMRTFGRYTTHHENYYDNPYYARYGYTD
jgi:polysaccharide biosynthesis transport protein